MCALASRLQAQVRHTEALNAKMAHEMAVLKRLKFAATSERFNAEQKSLLDEAIDEAIDEYLQALTLEIAQRPSRAVLHADETPVAMLKPGHGKTHRAYLWSYCATVWDDINAVVFDFAESRAGHNARLNGLEPHAYLKDVLARLPTQPASAVTELLPYRWKPAA